MIDDDKVTEEKPIYREGKLIGYWQYTKSGYSEAPSFYNYRWLKGAE